ncbi:MAG: class I SAM-dependent methyltransferase [Deltaproteobacteria bacterium]|nr:class I SAM-dependent methyltransferase [Deltaproteobacteria bacterium]
MMTQNVLTKHDVLTVNEMSKFTLNARILRYIERCREAMNLEKSEMNLLDWGCGRGRAILFLRSQGYNACGTDIDPEPVNNCRELLSGHDHDPESVISLMEGGEERQFPDAYFHLSFSEGVFEHVKNLEQVARNLKRVTKPGGKAIHLFPARRHFVEIHLRMPFLHWLPKNALRRFYISFLLLLGKGPKWKEVNSKSRSEQVQVYYDYINDKTYYRKLSSIIDIFQRNRFEVEIMPLADFGLDKHPILKRFVKFKPLRPMLDWAMRNFGQVGLLLTRRAD